MLHSFKHREYRKIEWALQVQANERDKLKLANGGTINLSYIRM